MLSARVKLPSPGDRMIDWENVPFTVLDVKGDEGSEKIDIRYDDGAEITYWWVDDGDFQYDRT